jgi:hypothetical protein
MRSEEIELAFPIIADHKSAYFVSQDIVQLLLPVIFRDYFINMPDRLEYRESFRVAKDALLAFLMIELVSGKSDYEIIAQRPRAFQYTNMTYVE